MVSILIPIYNGIEFITDSVTSVLNQTYTEWELLIAVNGHPPNSIVYKLAKQYETEDQRIRVFDFHDIRGKAHTLNALIPFCNYDFVAILDVDDIWHPQKLELQAPFLGQYDVVGSQCIYFGDRNGEIPGNPMGDISDVDMGLGNPVINSSAVIRKTLCHWNENGIEDFDLWIRLRKENRRFYNYHAVLVKHRIHKTSAFNSKGHGDKHNALLQGTAQN